MIRQLSIFAENRRGAMNAITKVLTEKQINMNTLVTNDSAEFGIIRMLVSDTDAALQCMQTAGYLCHVDTVAAAEIGDECGSLNALLDTLDRGKCEPGLPVRDLFKSEQASRGDTAHTGYHGGGRLPSSKGV